MKKLTIILIMAFQVIKALSQVPAPYYNLHDACETNSEKCWKLGLCWNEELMDYSSIHESEMLFSYFPQKNPLCIDSTTYKLTPSDRDGEFAIWQYKNANISIQVRMRQVESLFGYQLFDVRLKNTLVNDCQPLTFVWEY
jgi:hypothetical protein